MAIAPPAPGPATRCFAITPSNTVNFTTIPSGIWVGGAGDVTLLAANDTVAVTFTAVAAGTLLPIAAKRVNATGTSATLLVGFA